MSDTGKTVVFVVMLTGVCALLLSGMYSVLKPIHDFNKKVYTKKQVISSLRTELENVGDLNDQQVEELFKSKVKELVIDANGDVVEGLSAEAVEMDKEAKKPLENRRYPLYVYEDGGSKRYIMGVRGKGLWDAIWGYIAVKEDGKSVVGVAFDHAAETPGLGAEIKDNKAWYGQFAGKNLYDEAGNFTSVLVRKGGAKNDRIEVDGISGATITANGVSEMMQRGLAVYTPYFKKANVIK